LPFVIAAIPVFLYLACGIANVVNVSVRYESRIRESGAAEELVIFAASAENEYALELESWAGKFDQPGWKCSAGGGELRYGCKSGLGGADSIP
jgi:hypothetical protein